MEKVCAWCKSLIGYITTSVSTECNITHGICNSCADKLNAEMGVDLSVFLNELEAPVVLVDKDGIVRNANNEAQSLLNKNIDQISDYPGGEVFDCIHSKEPDGCGNTIHCVTCTIRNCVMATFNSGVSLLEKPALLHTGDPEKPVKLDFLISTEKVDGFVLLRVDDIRIDRN